MTSQSAHELQLCTSGILKVPVCDGDSIKSNIVKSGNALTLLSYRISIYEHLRVRDLLKMLTEYPELSVVIPGLDKLSDKYQALPKIGCVCQVK